MDERAGKAGAASMAPTPALATLLPGLRQALRSTFPAWPEAALDPLPDHGLAHWHLRLGHGRLARVPKQSQMGLAAEAHLAYEAACFERAAAGGHTPRLHGALPPTRDLPRGALIVDEIVGRPARLPGDLPALADALAALHALPLPRVRAPLLDPASPLAALRADIEAQARYLEAARLAAPVHARIEREIERLHALARGARPEPPRRLIAFDAHPGNFLVRADVRAMLVDLEKARYGAAALDLAHATQYTSTTWDVQSHAVLSHADVIDFYRRWLDRAPKAKSERPWLVPLRRAMWLWSVTWCAKWRVLSEARPATSPATQGEDWSAALSEAALVTHVRDRVDHYLSSEAVTFVLDEAAALDAALA